MTLKSNLCKDLTVTLFFFCFFIFVSCQDKAKNQSSSTGDSAQVTNTDTTHTGLDGTRDQSASLSTDVKTDTSSGQTKSGEKSKSPNTGDSTRK